MKLSDWLREKYIYIAVLSLLLLLFWTIWLFQEGKMDVESAKVYLQALTALATLALLYYSYYNVVSKREEDISRLELAVRPILVWELESEGKKAILTYKTIKHPLYDFKAIFQLGGKTLEIDDRHLDVSEAHPGHERVRDVTDFISSAIGSERAKVLNLNLSYHSEVGGRYDFLFTKEVVRKTGGFVFQHRKIISAKYPWRAMPVVFEDE